MSRKINITWEVSDGYAGKSRPHNSIITEDDTGYSWDEWDELDDYIKDEIIESCIQEDFNEKISWCIMNQTDE